MPNFFHWGIIFSAKFAGRGNLGLDDSLTYGEGRGYVCVAVLTLSLAVSIFLCGAHSYGSYRFMRNLDAGGDYIYDDAAEVAKEAAMEGMVESEGDSTISAEETDQQYALEPIAAVPGVPLAVV